MKVVIYYTQIHRYREPWTNITYLKSIHCDQLAAAWPIACSLPRHHKGGKKLSGLERFKVSYTGNLPWSIKNMISWLKKSGYKVYRQICFHPKFPSKESVSTFTATTYAFPQRPPSPIKIASGRRGSKIWSNKQSEREAVNQIWPIHIIRIGK